MDTLQETAVVTKKKRKFYYRWVIVLMTGLAILSQIDGLSLVFDFMGTYTPILLAFVVVMIVSSVIMLLLRPPQTKAVKLPDFFVVFLGTQ